MRLSFQVALGAWIGLLALLGLQLVCALLPLGSWHLLIALALSGAMAGIVAYAFMELASAPKLASIFAYAGLAWLMILFSLGGADYLTRLANLVVEPIRRLAP
jgi:caa(3)-type oxidase subunit IV